MILRTLYEIEALSRYHPERARWHSRGEKPACDASFPGWALGRNAMKLQESCEIAVVPDAGKGIVRLRGQEPTQAEVIRPRVFTEVEGD